MTALRVKVTQDKNESHDSSKAIIKKRMNKHAI
jgi:hypothetical protein